MKKRALGSVFQRGEDGRWVVRVTLPGGKRVTRYAKEKAEAERLLATLLTTPDLAPAAPYTVATWLDEYLKRANRGKAPATILDRKYLADGIKRKLGGTRLDKLSPAQVQAFVDGLSGAHRTRLKSLQLLRSALGEAVALGHLQRNPALPVKIERQPARKAGVSWTQTQARAFLEANSTVPDAPLWRLALLTGARIGELLALKVSDYDKTARTLRIERTLTRNPDKVSGSRRAVGRTKTEAGTRSFPLSPDAVAAIETQLAARESLKEKAGEAWQEEGWLFPLDDGRLAPYEHARWLWDRALKRAPDVPRIRTHDLRVTFISLALRRGVKPEVVARMVGHSSPLITLRIYRQVFEDEFEEAREMLTGLV